MSQAIAHTRELERVLALEPRRPMADDERLAISRWLRRRGASAELREAQATALRELYEMRGLFAPMRVGSGKTLVTLLAMHMAECRRPVLLTFASMERQLQADCKRYAADWHVRCPEVMTYESIGVRSGVERLLRAAPDLVIADEAHAVRNTSAARTARFARALAAHGPVVALLSGTLITDRFADYAHMLVWALGESAPAPLSAAEASRWADALDADVPVLARRALGALEQIPGGYHAHMRSRAGVIVTPGQDCDASIYCRRWRPVLPDELARAIELVDRTKMRPDGELLTDMEAATCMQQLACGFWYRWDPAPPTPWLVARRRWLRWARRTLEELAECDSDGQLRDWLDAERAEVPNAATGRALLAAWRAIDPTYKPTTVPVWVSDEVLRQAVTRARPGCLIWSRFTATGERLAQLGVPNVAAGEDPLRYIGQTISVSIDSHGVGQNLQAWSRNLLLTVPSSPHVLEQLMGRTHRQGQRADEVHFDFNCAARVQASALDRVRTRSKHVGASGGFSQKIVDATWVVD